MKEEKNPEYDIMIYGEIDGINTFTDSQIKALFTQTKEEGLFDIVFCEGTIRTEKDFLHMVKDPGTVFYLLFSNKKLSGYVWLNRFENHTARTHFCLFKNVWGNSVPLGRFCLDFFSRLTDGSNNYLFDLLTGIIPAWNNNALYFSDKCGWQRLGVLPNGVWNAKTNSSQQGVFLYYDLKAKRGVTC